MQDKKQHGLLVIFRQKYYLLTLSNTYVQLTKKKPVPLR